MQKASADNAIRFLDSLKIPHNKLVIGAAFYARIYEQTDTLNHGLYQPCRFKGFAVYKTYNRIFSPQNGFTCYRDQEAQAPWCYNVQKRLFATFDDSVSVQKKTQYAIDKHLYGIMFWELRQDKPHNGLLDAIYDIKKAQLQKK
jgi:chitinase